MRLSYASLFPHQVKHAWCKRKRLTQDNAYDLPTGDYCLYDLYPLSGISEPDIYFTVECRKQPTLTATLRCLLSRSGAEISLSHEHLQSPEAPRVRNMVQDLLNEDAPLRKLLRARKQEVQLACQTIAVAEPAPESTLISETAIRKLAGTFEQVLSSSDPDTFSALLDELLNGLRHNLEEAFAAQHGDA
ncbi:MAG: hypothetical protein ACO1RX_22300 [Candidatus Sericytochromatia bacterium]